jgi:hypothetical protein
MAVLPVSSQRARTCRCAVIRSDKGLNVPIHPFLNFSVLNRAIVDTSLLTAIIGAQTGMMQLAVATRLERMNAQEGSSVVQLIDAAQQSFNSLANVTAGIGTNLDVSA